GPGGGSCGVAAFRRESVVSVDIAADPLWGDHSASALRHGLRAAWSEPLVTSDGGVLGTVVMYFAEPRTPSDGDRELIKGAGRIALMAIERKRADEALRKAQEDLAHVTRVATLGEMTASIAHEINQPLGAIINNASACLRWLSTQNLEEARDSAVMIVTDGHR